MKGHDCVSDLKCCHYLWTDIIPGIKVLRNLFLGSRYLFSLHPLIKYAYMCHFYANPLSILLAIPSIDSDSLEQYLSTTHLDAIRSLQSMRKYVEEKLAEKDVVEVKSILLDNAYLISILPQFVYYLQSKARELRAAVTVLAKLSERGVKTRRGPAEL